MIRKLKLDDIYISNELLKIFNFSLNPEILENSFTKVIVYYDKIVKGILVYDYIYDRIEIKYLIVNECYRRNGIATKLLKYIEKSYNINNITLEVRKSNLLAIEFYKKNGFSVVATRKNYYGNEDGYLMLKKIGGINE